MATTATATQFTMARDQFGNTYHDLGATPRKALLDRLGYRKAVRMYRDTKDGATVHVGWIVGPHWCEVFYVQPMRAATNYVTAAATSS